MPVTENLPEAWYVSPNAHLCTIKDFADLCRLVDARVERAVAFNGSGQQLGTWIPLTVHNLMGEKAVFMLTRQPAALNATAHDPPSSRPRTRSQALASTVARGLSGGWRPSAPCAPRR